MKHYLKTVFLPFFLSVCCCSVLFLSISMLALPQSKTAETVQPPYDKVLYDKPAVTIIIHLYELRLIFLTSILPGEQSVSVTCIPEQSVLNSRQSFESNQLKKSGGRFFAKAIDRSIRLCNDAFSDIVDSIGGININTPYGLPASGNSETLVRNEVVHIYGYAALALLAGEHSPAPERLTYYAELVCRVTAGFLSGLSLERYSLFSALAETDICYADCYDFIPYCQIPFSHMRFGHLHGVWMNESYYILDNTTE